MPELFNVLPPQAAKDLFCGRLSPLPGEERIPTWDALGRICRRDIFSPSNLPAFSRSTMDGYAVRARDTYGASEGIPAYLTVAGEAPMGRAPEFALASGQAALVHTGGMLPEGADAVVMVEQTQQAEAGTVEVLRPVAPGENVIQVGDDVKEGALLAPAGRWLRPQDIGGLVAVGITSLPVAPRPKVALIATGDELVGPGESLRLGQVRDINTYTISGLVQRAGGTPVSLGIVPDDREALRRTAQAGLDQADMVVISAGSSVSTRDMTAEVIASLGEPGVLVHGIAIRPGKPTILAIAQGKPVVGLPGNPVSAMVVFELLVTPALHKLAGCVDPPGRSRVEAYLARNIASIAGREDHVAVRLEQRNGATWAVPVFGESNLITTLMKADGTVVVPLDKLGLPEGEKVTVDLFGAG
ncbi:MAG: molybdopterin molybdotransferase MoeA [Chloroflexi bacterium]|nr:molybdopterin molybdotransferase MoeA [Chloroflexota bacterium]